MTKKYEFTGATREVGNVTLQRIRALIPIDAHAVKPGDLGGWIESEHNLVQDGSAWVANNAQVWGDAVVSDNAVLRGAVRVCDTARIFGNARVSGDAQVGGNAAVYDNAIVFGSAIVRSNARVFGRAQICGSAEVFGAALVYGKTHVYGHALVASHASVFDDAVIYGRARVVDEAVVSGNARITDNARIFGTAHVTVDVTGNAELYDGVVNKTDSYICAGPIGSRHAYTTYNLVTGTVCTGCFRGSLAAFERAVESLHGNNEHAQNYRKLISYFRSLSSTNQNEQAKEKEN